MNRIYLSSAGLSVGPGCRTLRRNYPSAFGSILALSTTDTTSWIQGVPNHPVGLPCEILSGLANSLEREVPLRVSRLYLLQLSTRSYAVGTRICSLRRVIRLCRVGRINLSGGFVTWQTEIALWPGAHMVRSYM